MSELKGEVNIKENRIYQGDNRELIKKLPDNSVDLIINDPPYLTTKEVWDQEEVFSSDFIKEQFRVLKPTGSLYCWCGIGEKSQSLIRWFPLLAEHFVFKDLITWKKQRGYGARRGWLYTREELLWFIKDPKQFFWNKDHQYSKEKRVFTATYKNKARMKKYRSSVKSEFKRWTNVWTDIRETNICHNEKKEKIKFHKTPKPLKAVKRIILSSTNPGDLVLSTYLGSGQDVVGAIQTKRKYIGFDLSKEYVGYVNRRIDYHKENLT